MGKKYQRYKNKVEKFLASEFGRRFFNFAYSLGAAVVILGALFKILHLPGGNVMLSIGMGVEVCMFCLSALEKPGKEYNWEEVFPVLTSKDPDDRPDFSGGGNGQTIVYGNTGVTVSDEAFAAQPIVSSQAGMYQTTPQVSHAAVGISPALNLSEEDTAMLAASIQKLSDAAEQITKLSSVTDATQAYVEKLSAISAEMNPTVYASQMEQLSANLSALNIAYENQVRSINDQLSLLSRATQGLSGMRDMVETSLHDSQRFRYESEKMTQNMAQINGVYERMLSAMTVTMYGTSPRHPGAYPEPPYSHAAPQPPYPNHPDTHR